MSRISDERYIALRQEFELAKKKILKKNLSKNENKLEEYLEGIVQTHNKLVTYAKTFYDNLTENDKLVYRSSLVSVRDITIQCLTRLNKNAEISNDLCEAININDVRNFERENTDSEAENDDNFEIDFKKTK